jgi:DNA repair exonuclease SbcCD ATPase subunit
LSTLTKTIIILLTLSTIFLCGIVVTYVANAENYKAQYTDLKTERDALSKKVKGLEQQVNDKTAEKQQLEDKANSEIAALKQQASEIQTKFDNAEREKSVLVEKVNNWASITKDFQETNDKQAEILKAKLEELKQAQEAQIQQRKELKETESALLEKMAILETLQSENKRLAEEKAELQNRLDRYLQPMGRTAAAAVPVTPEKGAAKPAAPKPVAGAEKMEEEGEEIGLTGLVKKVDLKNSLVSISIGSADGVKEQMKFHVTRGDEFICDIAIIDVDTDESVGVLELVQQQPKEGDTASTNF